MMHSQPPVSVVTVIPPLDIFKVDPYGNVRWFEPAGDMEAAKARLEVLGTAMPGQYVVLSQKTGEISIFNVDKKGKLSYPTGESAT